jgi:lipoprotein-releasing system ATP-binding protein
LAAVVATHNMELAARMDRRVTLKEGRVVEVS